VRPDGRGRRRLTRDGTGRAPYLDPQLSADGRTLTFGRGAGRYVADRRARHRRKVAGNGFSLVLRPDGREAFYFRGFPGALLLCRVATARGATPRCARRDFQADAGYWAWGPHGSIVSVVDAGTDRSRLCVASAEGACARELVRLAPGEGTFFFPSATSPDGRLLASAVERDGVTRIEVFDVRTGRHVRDVTDANSDYPPAWSPDGRSIVFRRERIDLHGPLVSQICVVAATGGDVRVLAQDARELGAPTWGRG
jgi:Tol biopolymer transport system component